MKKTGRLSALLLALVMVLSLAACGSSESTSASTEETSAAETGGTADTDAATAETETADDVWDGEITEINVYLMDLAGVSENAQTIVDAMNEITEESIGVRANITYLSMGDYSTQLSLAISTGDQIDLCMVAPTEATSFTSLIANGQLMDITEYMQDEGAETLELLGDYIDAYTIAGSIYGLPVYRDYSSSVYLCMRKDILEELDLVEFAENMTTWDEVEQIFAAVAENTDLSPIAGPQRVAYEDGNIYTGETFAETITFDTLSDELYIVYTDEDGNVSLLAENEDFRAMMDMVSEWYDNGWIYEDSTILTDTVDTLIKAGTVFGEFVTAELGVETDKEDATGYEMVCVKISTNQLSSTSVNIWGIGVPITAEEPEAAIRWLNALYNSEELMNLIVWGIEGEDYVINDEGEAAYPEGSDGSVSYHTVDFAYGNYFLVLPWEGSGSNFREEAYEDLLSADVSEYLGFTVDQSELDNEIAAVTAVTTKYEGTILCGTYTDSEYEEYIQALKDAGVEDLLAAYQEQLDEWIAENK